MIKKNILSLFSVILLISLAHCGSSTKNLSDETSANTSVSPVSLGEGWYGSNAQSLQNFISSQKSSSNSVKLGSRKVAVFDWDNTVIKNDVGDITLFWMLKNNKILHREWNSSSALLSESAKQTLNSVCTNTDSAGDYFMTDRSNAQSIACADEILSIYMEGKTIAGEAAFSDQLNPNWIEPAYAWAVQLQAGYSPQQMREIASQAFEEALLQPVATTQQIGSTTQNAYLRVYEPIKNLMNALRVNGFEVWVVSASSQFIVEEFASKYVGVPREKVIGVRSALEGPEQIISSRFQSCGSLAAENESLITYKQGKRCFINKVIFGIESKNQMTTASPTLFVAGDSDTDLWMLKDAQGLRLVINRNKTELMCNAYQNSDGKWLVNPMFIAPKSKKVEAYSCESFGIANQEDSVF